MSYIVYPNRARPQSAARMFTTPAARAAYTVRAKPHTRSSSSTCIHARRPTLSPPRATALSSQSRSRARVQPSPRTATISHGLPIPIIGGLFNAPLMTIMYVFIAIKMYLGYDRTTFGSGVPKVVMVGLWPVLAVLSASFRENLKRAM